MLSEEYIRREKQVAEWYKRDFDSRPEFKKEMKKLRNSLLNDEITPEEFRKRALEFGEKYD